MTRKVVRQIDSYNAALIYGLSRALNGLVAKELGLDATVALALDFNRFSIRNPMHELAQEARVMALNIVSTGYDVTVGQMASVLHSPKQVISRHLHAAEDLRDKPVNRLIYQRVEKMLGVE